MDQPMLDGFHFTDDGELCAFDEDGNAYLIVGDRATLIATNPYAVTRLEEFA